MDKETQADQIEQYRTIRRHEAIFGALAVLLIVIGLLVFSYGSSELGAGLCAIGGICFFATRDASLSRKLKLEDLTLAGPAAIGPLIEGLYYNQPPDVEAISEARKQTAATLFRLLGSASSQHLLTLTDREAACFYSLDSNWSDDSPEYQLLILEHLSICFDVRAIPWVIRLIERPRLSKHSKEVIQRAQMCLDLLIQESAGAALLRPSEQSSPLLKPVEGSTPDTSKLDPILLRPSSDE